MLTMAAEAIAPYVEVPGSIELLAPAHQGGDEKTGSTLLLRTMTHYSPTEGRHVRLPHISGNSIRGQLRRLAMRDMLRRLGYELRSKTVYYSFFSGGVLSSTHEDEGVVDLELRRQARRLLPPVALFGCAIGNQNIDSSLRVAHAMPVCREYACYLREDLAQDPRAGYPVRTFCDFSFFSRRDELHLEREQGEQAVQMLVEFEVLVPGTLFQHDFTLEWPTELEASCLRHLLQLWAESLHVGGRAASGYGRARARYSLEALPPADLYLRHLEERKDEIVEFLSWLEGRFP